MRYVIRGGYPQYEVTGRNGDSETGWVYFTCKDFAQVMDTFKHRMQPGDSIQWEKGELEGRQA